MMSFQVAIDGPSASGKSTVAEQVAEAINGFYVNTGNMYRALTMVCLNQGVDVTSEQAVNGVIESTDIQYVNEDGFLALYVDGEAIDLSLVRVPEVASKVSIVAKYPAVRQWLVGRQRLSAELGNVVMEGRDIGTVVFPQAKFKFFITASPEERARRRLAQPGETVDGATLAKVAADIAARDKMDRERKVSPLKPAEDAILLDTTHMTIDEVVSHVKSIILQSH
jgi:cytidylate kinase